jgi:hypothetical protein
MQSSTSKNGGKPSQLLLLRITTVVAWISGIFCFIHYGISLHSFDGLRILALMLILLIGSSWRTVGLDRSFGPFLVWLSIFQGFVRSCLKHQPDVISGFLLAGCTVLLLMHLRLTRTLSKSV